MDIPVELLPAPWRWSALVVYLIIMGAALYRAEWRRLKDPYDSHVFFAACVGVLGCWLMRVGVAPGLHLHLLGMALLSLMFGWRFALVGGALVLTAVTWNHELGLASLGVNGLLTNVLPVAVAWGILNSAERYLPANFFVYLFVSAFFSAGLAMLAVGGATSMALWASGAYAWDYLFYHYTAYYLFLAFPEAFLTGGLMAIFVLFRPEWVATFQDSRYLDSHSK